MTKNEVSSDTDKPRIKLNNTLVTCNKGETVLDALERNGIEVQFNCREGFCGVCRTKLLTGNVEYLVDPLAFIDDDEILSCCTTPKSDIEIKIEN